MCRYQFVHCGRRDLLVTLCGRQSNQGQKLNDVALLRNQREAELELAEDQLSILPVCPAAARSTWIKFSGIESLQVLLDLRRYTESLLVRNPAFIVPMSKGLV